jgi:hypothetical protein
MSATANSASASTMSVTSLVLKQLENAATAASKQNISILAKHFGFDEAEALSLLDIKVEEKKMAPKAKAVTGEKAKFIPLPWMGMVNPICCQAIAFNYGLFTQCLKKKVDGQTYCASCQKEANGEASGKPKCGTINDRLAVTTWSDYKDSKGRSPLAYNKVLNKQKLTVADAVAYATSRGLVIPDIYIKDGDYVAEPIKKARAKAVVTSDTESVASSKKEEKALASSQKALAKAEEKKQTTTARLLATAGKSVEQIVAEGISQTIAENAVKAHEEKVAKQQAAAQARAVKKQEAAQAKAEKKEAVKLAKQDAKQSVSAEVKKEVSAIVKEVKQEQSVKVQRINLAGEVVKKGVTGGDYLRDTNNIVYNADTKEIIGKWSVDEKKIVFNEASSEVEEEEYI